MAGKDKMQEVGWEVKVGRGDQRTTSVRYYPISVDIINIESTSQELGGWGRP